MHRADFETALEWAAAEGWNPGNGEPDVFDTIEPGSLLVGLVGDEPAACISVATYGGSFAFLGLYICRPEFRGRGYGKALWDSGMAHAGTRTVGLDGVVAQQANYARSGYAFAHRNIRFGGRAMANEIADRHIVELRPSRPGGLAGAVVSYDRAFFPGTREAFLRRWLNPPHRRTVVWIEDNGIRGYGAIRACREGHKIGPLFADTEAIAERLFAALIGRLYGQEIYIDVPEPNIAGVAAAEQQGLTPVFETARMYRGPAPALPLARIFGITTLEFG